MSLRGENTTPSTTTGIDDVLAELFLTKMGLPTRGPLPSIVCFTASCWACVASFIRAYFL